MAYAFSARNVNTALSGGLDILLSNGVKEDSRNGPVIVAPAPVITTTSKPMERVLFSPLRNANPFFHLFESLWMLDGRNDLPWLAQFNKRMAEYSDDGGKTQPGAYGYRWRSHFGYDQLTAIAEELKARPNSRRAVLGMWDPWGIHTMSDGELQFKGDLLLASDSKDVPCNTQCFFRIHDGALHMTVCCRSNDAVWGAHGANAVHFSVLLEYMAALVGVEVGTMVQFSNNYHLYPEAVKVDLRELQFDADTSDNYWTNAAQTTPVISGSVEDFHRDLSNFMELADPTLHPPMAGKRSHGAMWKTAFFRDVAVPMLRAWDWHKVKQYDKALAMVEQMPPHGDWSIAARQWLERRRDARDARVEKETGR